MCFPLNSAKQLCIDDLLMRELINELANLSSSNKYKVLDPDKESVIQLSPPHSPIADEPTGDNRMIDTQPSPLKVGR